MIYVVATTKVKPEGREAFIAGAKACIAETHKEKGCISYELHSSVNDPNTLVFVERWETRDDLTAHSRAPRRLFRRGIGPVLPPIPSCSISTTVTAAVW